MAKKGGGSGPATAQKNVIIRASAGSGKTYQLTNRLLALLFAGTPVESILATTFSRKAAGEILDRLMSRLATAAQDSEECEQLSHAIGVDVTPQACRAILRKIIKYFHHVQIRTLDSFFVRAAQALNFELGLWPDWQIDEGDQTERINRIILAEILHKRDRVRQWMQFLFKGQAVRTITTQLRDIIAAYYENVFLEAEPTAWQAVGKRAALSSAELTKALAQLRKLSGRDYKSSLLDALEADLERASSENWEEFLKRGIAAKVAVGEKRYKKVEIPPELEIAYQPLVDHAKAVILNRLVEQTLATYELLHEFHQHYAAAIRERGILRFSDVARLLRDYLQATGSAGLSLWQRRLGWRIRHLLLDEFQDTSAVQWAVLAPFAEEVCRSHDGSFFCVGDVKQSIYGWRGSEPEIFAQIESELPEVDVQNLDITWRSSPIIVDVVNDVFSTLTQNPVIIRGDNLPFWRRAAEAWVSRFSMHHTRRVEYPGYCCVVVRQKGGQSEEDQSDGEDVTLADPILVNWIGEVYQAPSKPTIGVLVRRNAAIDPIVAALRGAGFEVSQEGRNPVTTAVSVQLVLNVLRIADHPGDTAAAFRLGHSPLASLLGWEEFPRWDGPTRREKSLETSHRLRERLLDEGYGKVIREFADAISEHTPREEHLWLEKLVELAHTYDEQRTLRADDFIRWLEHQQVADPQLTRIRVMTIHGAKGLQFDAVFLPDLDEPVGRRTGQLVFTRPTPGKPIDWVFRGLNQELVKANVFESDLVERYYAFQQRCVEEDFSLLYVAMTRAIHGLYIFVSPAGSGRSGPPKTLASIVWNGLRTEPPRTPGDILFEHGQRDWFNQCPSSVPSPAAEPETGPVLSDMRNRPGRLRRSIPWRTPHEVEGTGISADDILRFQPVRSLAKGSVWHMWFSRVRWVDHQGIPSPEELRKTLAPYPEMFEAFETLYREFVEMLGRPKVKQALSLAEYQGGSFSKDNVPAQAAAGLQHPRWEVFLEQPFVVDAPGAFCRGQFDRVVVLFDGDQPIAADVIDFKTDDITPDQLAGRVEFYRPQLVLYREAAARWLHVSEDRVSARLVFTQPGEVIRVV